MLNGNVRVNGNKRILVADDVEINQMLARHLMESWGFKVTVAENGKQVIQEVLNDQYDLILMDIQMPEMDGVEATRQIRRLTDKTKASVPIVALTANLLEGDSDRYIAAGMNDYLAKPIDEKKLFEIISKNINSMQDSNHHDNGNVVSSSVKLYDLSLVEAISGGDERFIESMLILFLETVPVSVTQIDEACNAGNWELTSKLAHKIKSTIDSMNISSLKEVIRKIESDGKKGEDLGSIPMNVDLVKKIMGECVDAVKRDYSL